VPLEAILLEANHGPLEQLRVVAGDAKSSERERLGVGARSQPLWGFRLDPPAVAEGDERIETRRGRGVPGVVGRLRGDQSLEVGEIVAGERASVCRSRSSSSVVIGIPPS
jgi:hypothetical protein